VNWKDPEVVRH